MAQPGTALAIAQHHLSSQVAQHQRSGVPFKQPITDDLVNYFELNFDVIHIVLSFLSPKVGSVSTLALTLSAGFDEGSFCEQVFSLSRR